MDSLLQIAQKHIEKPEGNRLSMKDLKPLEIIPVRELDASEHHYTLLALNDVAYAFLGATSPCPCKTGETQQYPDYPFRENRLYIRNIQGRYFTSPCRSLKALCAWVAPHLFLNIQKSLVINMKQVKEIDFNEKQLGIGLNDGSLMWFGISRRYIKTLRQLFFCPEET